MPKAVKGTSHSLTPSTPFYSIQSILAWLFQPPPGVLVEVDPSIKAIILKIDSAAHDYIVEDLDDQTLVIKESQLQKLKARLEEVSQV